MYLNISISHVRYMWTFCLCKMISSADYKYTSLEMKLRVKQFVFSHHSFLNDVHHSSVSCVDLHVYIPKFPLLLPVLYSLLHITVLSWLTCHTVGFYPTCLTPICTLSWFPVATLRNSTVNAALVLTIFSIESGKAFWSNNKQCYNIQSWLLLNH